MAEIHKILIFLKRKPGTSVAAFRDHYENHHVPLCMRYMGAATTRYFRRYLDTFPDAELEHDVVTELWFDDRAAFETALNYAGRGILPEDVIADEESFLDRSKSRFTWVTECETDLTAAK